MSSFEQNHKSINFKNNLGVMKPHFGDGQSKAKVVSDFFFTEEFTTKLTEKPVLWQAFWNQPVSHTPTLHISEFFHTVEMNVSSNENTVSSEYIKLIDLVFFYVSSS